MIRFVFGVMSSKYELMAPNEVIANVSMCLWFGQNVPVAVYEPRDYGFWPKKVLKQNDPGQLDGAAVRACMKSIKKVSIEEVDD